MSTVLVTGGNGFIGRPAVANLIALGHEVDVASRRDPVGTGARWEPCDLLDPSVTTSLVERVRADVLVHLAWYAEPGRFWSAAPENLAWLEATTRLFRAFASSGGRRVVVAGTAAEYGHSPSPLPEDAPTRPVTMYGSAKHACHVALGAAAAELGVSLCWTRLFQPYGPNEPAPRLIPSVIDALRTGRAARCTSGTQVRDFVYVDDVGRALALLVDAPVDGAVNIGTGIGTSVRDVVLRISDALGRRDLVEFGAIADDPSGASHLVADTARLAAHLGWVPPTTVAEGLDRTIAWHASR